jgi:hypothetical protein
MYVTSARHALADYIIELAKINIDAAKLNSQHSARYVNAYRIGNYIITQSSGKTYHRALTFMRVRHYPYLLIFKRFLRRDIFYLLKRFAF